MRRALSLLGLLSLWEVGGLLGWINPFYAPPPHQIVAVLIGLFVRGEIWPHLEATFAAALLGLFLGLLIGGGLGLFAALVPLAADLFEPIMMLFNAVPRVILAPLMVIWFGIGLGSKVALSLVLVTVLVFFAVYSGVKDVDPRLVERVRTLGGGRRWLLTEVYLPSVMAWVLSSLKVAVGFAFTGAVVGEFVAASRGLGYLLSFAQSTYNASLTLALIVLIMAFVLVLFYLFGRIEAKLLVWKVR